jgi:hypothetical protein
MAAASGHFDITTAGPVLDTTNQISAYARRQLAQAGFTVGTDFDQREGLSLHRRPQLP